MRLHTESVVHLPHAPGCPGRTVREAPSPAQIRGFSFITELHLADLPPELVRVELYAEPCGEATAGRSRRPRSSGSADIPDQDANPEP